MSSKPARAKIAKTLKLFIGGRFPRSESGRVLALRPPESDHLIANFAHASPKDLRDAVSAAQQAQPKWAACTPYLRGQILYRAAEMLESRSRAIAADLAEARGISAREAARETEAAVDSMVSIAGWSDKLGAVFGSVNPVSGPHFNFSTIEPTGVAAVFCPDRPSLAALATLTARAIVLGNTTVIIASEIDPVSAIAFAEALATSDLPAGTVSILTGRRSELAGPAAGHREVHAILDASGDPDITSTLRAGAAENLKRVSAHALEDPRAWFGAAASDPYRILDAAEVKSVWHPIGW